MMTITKEVCLLGSKYAIFEFELGKEQKPNLNIVAKCKINPGHITFHGALEYVINENNYLCNKDSDGFLEPLELDLITWIDNLGFTNEFLAGHYSGYRILLSSAIREDNQETFEFMVRAILPGFYE